MQYKKHQERISLQLQTTVSLEFLLPPLTNLMFATESAVNTIKEGLSEFTEEDYLLLVGDPISIGIATHYAAKSSNVVNFLKWDNREYTSISQLL